MSTETRDAATDHAPEESPLLRVAQFEARNRIRVTVVIAVLFAVFGALYVWVGPQMVDAGFSKLIDAMPAVVVELFGFESLESLEGLLASEFYTLGWIVGFGAYLAYTTAGTVAGDLKDERMDTLLSGPVPRRSVLLGKFLAVLVPLVALSVVVPAVLYVMALIAGEPIGAADLAVLHVLSIPYLLFWVAFGLFLGVVVRRGRTAGRVALGVVFIAWLFESVISTTDFSWVGGLSPMRYFDPPAILVDGTFDVAGAGLLLVAALVFVGLSLFRFQRRDL